MTYIKTWVLAFMASVVINLSMVGNALAASAPPAKAFGELPIAWDAAISPQGDKLAIIVNVKGGYNILVQDFKKSANMSEPWFLALGGQTRPRYVKWVNDHRFVVSISQTESHRNTPFTMSYLFTGDVNEREGKILVKSKRIFRQFNDRVVDWLEDDPDYILMAFSDEAFDPFPDIKKVNVKTGRAGTVMRGKNLVETWITDNNGIPRIGYGESERGNKIKIIRDVDTDSWVSITDYPGLEVDTPIFAMIADGKQIVIGDYNGKDTLGLYLYDLEQKKIVKTIYHNDTFDASGVITSKNSGEVIGARYVGDRTETQMLNEYDTLMSELRAKYADFDVRFVDQTEDGRTLIVTISGPHSPGGLYSYSMGDSAPVQLTPLYTDLSENSMGNVIATSYTARDGQKIPAFITVPPTVNGSLKNLPFIVLPHGGPYARDEKRFDYFAQFFATRGYGVLQMNFRGSEGYGKSFADAGRNNWIVMQEDVEDGTKWLYDKGYADPDKTCIAGWSYGGYAALMGAAKTSELYQCAVAMAALTDIADAKSDFAKYRGGRVDAKEFFGEAMDDRDTRRANSPTQIADQISIPIFLAHGEDDQAVHFDQYTKMKKAMERAGVDGTYLSFKDEDHYLSTQANREAFFVAVEKFLLKVNGRSPYMAK